MKNKPKLRILFSSNAAWSPSGYSQQMQDLLPALRDEGYELGIVNFYGQEGGIFALDGIIQYPRINDVWGTDAVINHQKHFKPDCVITFQDIWPMDINALKAYKNWVCMVPVDHDPVPPPVLERLRLAYRVITHSKFGEKELKKQGMHSSYIPLLVNTSIYRPMNKIESKKMIGIPEDMFVFGMVSANKDNPPRKSFQEAMDAFKIFHDKHPKSCMYFHTMINQPGGFPIDQYANVLGIRDFIFNVDPYDQLYRIDKASMAKIYNSFDCLLAPSTNEGFGVPIIEAQSCGVPVITNNWTAMPELVIPGETGEICEVASKRFSALLSYIGVPSVPSIVEKMEKIFNADRVKMGKKARQNVELNYDLMKNVKEAWLPLLQKLEKELCP